MMTSCLLLALSGLKEKKTIDKESKFNSVNVVFYTCSWICSSKQWTNREKVVLLRLAFELFAKVVSISNIESIRSVLEDKHSFLSILFTVLHLNEPGLISGF